MADWMTPRTKDETPIVGGNMTPPQLWGDPPPTPPVGDPWVPPQVWGDPPSMQGGNGGNPAIPPGTGGIKPPKPPEIPSGTGGIKPPKPDTPPLSINQFGVTPTPGSAGGIRDGGGGIPLNNVAAPKTKGADGSMNWEANQPVPGAPGYHYNAAGGFEADSTAGWSPAGPMTVALPGETAQPTTPGTQTAQTNGQYKFANGTGPKLDNDSLTQQITQSYQKRLGRNPTSDELSQAIYYASKPDQYSDGKWRIGWNGYLEERLTQGVSSADPRLAGDEGVLLDYQGGGNGGGISTGGNGFNFDPNSIGLDDPATAQLMALITDRIKGLTGTVSDPSQDQYTKLVQDAITRLGTAQDQPQAVKDFLASMTTRQNQLNTPQENPQEYTDFLKSLKDRMTSLSGPETQPQAVTDFLASLTGRQNELSGPQSQPQEYADFLAQIKARMGELGAPSEQPAETQQYLQLLKDQMAKLQGDPFSDEQLGNMRTRAFDGINRQEQSEIENTVRQMGERGIPPTSGLVERAVQQVRQKYTTAKAQQQQELNQYEINAIEQRRSQLLQAAQAGSQVAQDQLARDEARKAQMLTLGQSAATMSLAERDQAENRKDKALELGQAGANFALTQRDRNDSRADKALELGQSGAQLALTQRDAEDRRKAEALQLGQSGATFALTQQQQEEQRRNQVISLAQSLVEMARNARGEQGANFDKAITLAGIPVDITDRRLAAAGNLAAGQATSPSSIVSTLSGLLNQGAGQNAANSNSSSNYIGNLISGLSQIDWSKVFKS